jgi:ATPase subunit of ABC transporter with duplicated ATPase domains
VNAANWINLVGVIVAGVSAIVAVRSACRARNAESAAAEHQRQSLKAAQDAANHAKRSADAEQRIAAATEAHQRRRTDEVAAAELDPWELAPIPGDPDCYLINTSKTAKYDVIVNGFKVHNGPARFDMIGPGKCEELSIMRISHPDDTVEVKWHRQQDLSDAQQTRRKTIPSTI